MKLRPEFEHESLIFDVETNGFLDKLSVIHCLVIREWETGQTWVFRKNRKEDTIAKGVAMLMKARRVIGHNVLAFDILAIKKVYPDFVIKGQIRDTLVMSQLIFANQKEKDFGLWRAGKLPGNLIGAQGLESWGFRLGLQKGTYQKDMEEQGLDPWAKWNQPMEDYCVLDVDVNTLLWHNLLAEKFPEESIVFEHIIADLMVMQERAGIHFDREAAEDLANEIETEAESLSNQAIEHFGSWYAPAKKKIVRPLWHDPEGINEGKDYPAPDVEMGENKKRGIWGVITTPKKTMKFKDIKKAWAFDDAPFVAVTLKEFKPTSRPMIIDRFTIIYNWSPVDFTEKGNPEVSDTVLQTLVGHIPMAKELAEIFYLYKRLGQIKTGAQAWLKHVTDEGKIHARVNVGGTVSGRCSHSNPNLAQVPRVVFGKDKDGNKKMLFGRAGKHGADCRDLFYVPPSWGRLVGADLSGVELRCLADATWGFDNGFLADIILNGDIHEVNRIKAGLATRDQAKTFIYACVPVEGTQALTKEGWKNYHEIRVGELVLTLNPRTGMKEWKPVLDKVLYHNAEVLEAKTSENFCVRATPNHKWFADVRKQGRGDRYYKEVSVTTSEITSEHRILVNAPMVKDEINSAFDWRSAKKYGTDWTQVILGMSSDERMAFLNGFILADGYQKTDGGWVWSQLTGDIFEAALLATYLETDKAVRVHTLKTSKNPMKQVLLSKKDRVTGQRLKIESIGTQDVWCLSTENESWVMRQGDTITITGNTIYGAGAEKIGSIVVPLETPDEQMKVGKKLLAQYMHEMPGLKKAIKQVQRDAKKKYLIGRDGRRLYVRGKHSALNLKLQHDGAAIAKQWVMLIFETLTEDYGLNHGWDGDFVLQLFIHDEVQLAVRDEYVELVQRVMVETAEEAGRILGFNVPIAAESKCGESWLSTH